jgi:SSS family solute:Na+ symporter
MPIIVMLPGIAAFVLYKNGYFEASVFDGKKDGAYAAILSLLPAGMKGLSIAALTAAIVASLAGKANSISTIFTLDIYHKYFNKNANEKKLVWMGRIVILVAILSRFFAPGRRVGHWR